MAHFHIKHKKGRPYLYVREIARVNGKPKVVSQVYIGSPEKVKSLVSSEKQTLTMLKVEEFGSLFLANLMDKPMDLASIVDTILAPSPRENGPSIGEYFLYAVLNRMVDPRGKNSLPEWFSGTAIQEIRPVEISQLTSERYWHKWDRVSEEDLKRISKIFFEKIWSLEKSSPDCLLFDTTNYYTYMSSQTDSELAMRGKNKEGKHHLRQVGLALLVSRGSRLPLFYDVYAGNLHDSKEFEAVMDEMFGIVCGFPGAKERLTVVLDKGMNSEDNFTWMDGNRRIHFLTTYSPYFADELAAISIERFAPVITKSTASAEEPVLAFRSQGNLWGEKRTIVVIYNPRTARKQSHNFESKLEDLREQLLEMRAKVNGDEPHWRKQISVEDRYYRFCEKLHMPGNLYELTFENNGGKLRMSFGLNQYRANRKRSLLGKSIIVTDNSDWSTEEIVQTHLDRWQIECQFRQSKSDDRVCVTPMRHWTDSKIRCHLFTCVVAMTYLRKLELMLEASGVSRTAEDVIEEMRRLHSVLALTSKNAKPVRRLESPTKTQSLVLHALGYEISVDGVLQSL